ncbi:MAG: energy transducer TonB [Gammaproteobacteria bacterium]
MSRYAVPAFALGVLVTLGLFWLMQFLTWNSQPDLKDTEALKMVEFVRLKREETEPPPKRILPPKPPPHKKPPPPTMSISPIRPFATAMPRIAMPDLDLPAVSARIEGSLLGGLKIGEVEGVQGVGSDLVPLFRVPPEYPLRAAKRRVEGWVRVEFTINEQGDVVDPVVVESHPSSVFNRAAINAVSKWKFKPKKVGGTAVAQRAVQLLEFKLTR